MSMINEKRNQRKKVENENRRESYKIFLLDLVNEKENLVGFIIFYFYFFVLEGELFCCCERMSETEYVCERERQIDR